MTSSAMRSERGAAAVGGVERLSACATPPKIERAHHCLRVDGRMAGCSWLRIQSSSVHRELIIALAAAHRFPPSIRTATSCRAAD